MRANVASVSHTGKVRQKNEDNLYSLGKFLPMEHGISEVAAQRCELDAPQLFGVFDGMGGYAAGEVASFIVASTAAKHAPNLTQSPGTVMNTICMEANDEVCRQMRKSGKRIGATASMVCLQGTTCTLCNIGDSPIFLFREHRLTPVFHEHSERESYEMITGHRADPKKKFKLTQNIGIFPEELQIEPYITTFPVMPGDLLLLCSDGLTDMVSLERLAVILDSGAAPAQIVSQCLSEALANGGKDNTTIICIRVEEAEQKTQGKSLWPVLLAGGLVSLALIVGAFYAGRASMKKELRLNDIYSASQTETEKETNRPETLLTEAPATEITETAPAETQPETASETDAAPETEAEPETQAENEPKAVEEKTATGGKTSDAP